MKICRYKGLWQMKQPFTRTLIVEV